MIEKRISVTGMDAASCNFEESTISGMAFEPLNPEDYPADQRSLIEEVNRRAALANEKYHIARLREEMLAKGFDSGMYICRFDENEQMVSFEFTDGTRKMLGYDGLEDLPNEFDSWTRTLVPEEKDILVKLFWDSVKNHRTLPDISHATYRMRKKDGSLIWVTGAGRFVRRGDGSLEVYMGCYREVTAEQEKDEYLKIIEGVGKVFNFSIYIDMASETYRVISSNDFVESVAKCENAFDFLRANVMASVAEEYHQELNEWLRPEIVLAELESNSTSVRDFYSDAADAWFRGIFMVGDRSEDGLVRHLIYGCQDIDEQKRKELAQQREVSEIRDIIASANMGTWSIELIEGQKPRMIVDDKMAELLGIKKEDYSPEETYNAWFSFIKPEAVESVLASVSKMQQGFMDENTYLWIHPVKGERYVRCGGTAEKVEGGFIHRGYHYDVDSQVRDELEKAEAARAQEKQLEELLKAREDDAIQSLLKIIIQQGDRALISSIMETVGSYYQADRCYIFNEDPTGRYIVNTYEWCAPGVVPEKDNLQEVPIKAMKPWLDEFKKRGTFFLTCDDEYVEKEPIIYEVLEPQNIQSLMAAPMVDSGREIGLLGVDNPRANTDHKLYLSIAATSAYHELRSIQERKQLENSMRRTALIQEFVQAGQWAYKIDRNGNVTDIKYDNVLSRRTDVAEHANPNGWLELIHPADQEETLAKFNAAIHDFSGNTPYEATYRILDYEGNYRWNKASGRLFARDNGTFELLGSSIDIHDQIAERNRYNNIIEAISGEYHTVWLITKSDLEMHFIRSNGKTTIQNAVNMGRGNANYDAAITKYINSYVVEEDRERVAESCKSSVILEKIRHQTLYNVNYKRRDDEGNVTYHQMAFADADDGFILAYHDIDALMQEEQRKQEALKNALSTAENANRAKSDFLQTMSHDIRTPMNGIIGMTAIAAAHIDDKERVQDSLTKITAASRHLLALINEVLDMSKIESGKVSLSEEEFNLSDLVDNLITMVRPQIAEHQHELSVNIQKVEHELVIGDSLHIQQAFVNLMSNAVKYTPDGGKIHLNIREIPCNQAKVGCYEFVFKDNGIGMSEEYLTHIFEPFSRAEDGRVSKVQGTGLGMPITKNIVNMMGGDIEVESKLNEGSTFTVTIFLKLQDADAEDNARFADLSVLVADDDEMSMESAVDILEELGIQAEGVLSGEAALERVVLHHEEKQDYNAVILDWKMPGMDGVETARAIRTKVGDDVPIIILSAYDWTDIEAEARAAGVSTFISKPLFKSRLERVFDEIIGEKQETEANESPLQELEQMDLSAYRCLLVEDNELNAEIAQEILEETGMKVEHVWDGAEAVEAVITAEDGKYDLVLMDIQMPKMNGYDAARAIRTSERKYCKTVPIIAMTANAFAEDVQAARTAGMNEHIAKPIDLKVLAKMMDKWLLKK